LSDDLTGLSLCEVADAIRRRRASSVEVAQACLTRIERLQPVLNCFIAVEAEAALGAARKADAELAKGRVRGPLHGVPLAHKDMFYREGRVASCGSSIRQDFVADRTSTAVARLEDAGAIQLGRLNMSEFAFWSTGFNSTFGTCVNPWDVERITGGSSSGSGAAVAARMVFGALGSDTGGSVRNPAGFCGIVGLKPTLGRISRYGAMPLSSSLDSIGPFGRTVRDCARLTGVIAGADPNDPSASAEPVPDYEAKLEGGIEGIRIGVPKNFFYDRVSAEVKPVLEASLSVLESLGAVIVEVAVPDPREADEFANLIIKAESAALHEAWVRDRREDYYEQLLLRVEPGFYVPAVRYIQALAMRAGLLGRFVETVFGHCDVLHLPLGKQRTPTNAAFESDPDEAARLAAPLIEHTRPLNYLGVPVLALPCGFLGDGLPLGCQLVGRPYAEALLFRVGHAYQTVTDWHCRAPSESGLGGAATTA
jgi:aspartyl-tRNA(Asn)/glutamyl-tRNA(Gln) amidotransferase subunit A